jgi:hypothetical protein
VEKGVVGSDEDRLAVEEWAGEGPLRVCGGRQLELLSLGDRLSDQLAVGTKVESASVVAIHQRLGDQEAHERLPAACVQLDDKFALTLTANPGIEHLPLGLPQIIDANGLGLPLEDGPGIGRPLLTDPLP